jgi:hypothetical protein
MVSFSDTFSIRVRTAYCLILLSVSNLHKANAAKGGSDAMASIMGPVAGGVIYGMAAILRVFLINAFSFALSGLL